MQHFAILQKVSQVALISVLAVGSASAAELKTSIDKAGYGAAYNFAKSIMQSGIKPDVKALLAGIEDGAANKDMRVSKEDLDKALVDVRQQIQDEFDKNSKANLEKGQAFLAKNKKAKGVTTTASGLQYQVIKAADKKAAKPTATDNVKVHYSGTLIDGTVFDSSIERGTPAEFNVSGVIKGWTEALQLMGKGAKWKIFIPAELAYGERGAGSIPPNSALIFDVELLDINPAKPAAK